MNSVSSQLYQALNFLLRVAVLSAIAFPVWAGEQAIPDASASETSPVAVTEGADAASSVPPAPVLAQSDSHEAAAPIAVGNAQAPHYWIVSSRCSVQHVQKMNRGQWGVQVYERTPDGQLHGSTLTTLRHQIVPGIPVCIFSHGSFVEWESQCREAHALYVRLRSACRQPLQMIFFTWPSDGARTGLFPIDVAVKGRQADFNGFHMAYLLSQIPPSCPVSLMGHSHGARVVLATMHMAGGGTIEGYRFPYSMGAGRRYRVILAAGAMDHDWLLPGHEFGCALNAVECLLNLRNHDDLPLAFYPFHRPFARRAVARSGITRHDLARLGSNAAKIRQYDVTNLIGHAHYWPYYYRQPQIIGAIVPYVYFY